MPTLSCNCPCLSGFMYPECCAPYILGYVLPKTPEQLMRSRYTAYTDANVDYIVRTMLPPASDGFNKKDTKKWANSVVWQGLSVLNSSANGDTGVVEFIAYYREGGHDSSIHEKSLFNRIDNKWFYMAAL